VAVGRQRLVPGAVVRWQEGLLPGAVVEHLPRRPRWAEARLRWQPLAELVRPHPDGERAPPRSAWGRLQVAARRPRQRPLQAGGAQPSRRPQGRWAGELQQLPWSAPFRDRPAGERAATPPWPSAPPRGRPRPHQSGRGAAQDRPLPEERRVAAVRS
jgi:hypothetical protein